MKRPVLVTDTTFVRRLQDLDLARVLPLLFAQVLIPAGVGDEFGRLGKGRKRLQRLLAEYRGFFEICRDGDPLIRALLATDLGRGESDAIAQAKARGAEVLVDEKAGYQRAEAMGLTVRRTGGVLVELKRMGAVASVKEKLDRLAALGFHLAQKDRVAILEAAGEPE